MTQKLFLTSFIAIGFVANAYAEPANTGEFPNDGLMQEDYTYTNAATETNMDGVYENEVNAVAEYENILYQLAAGQYLPANSETPTTCDQNGYFCAGDQNGVNYQSYAQGLTQCPNGYANSGTGASANTDCFRSCVTGANGDVPHSTGALTGGVYYDGTSGDGVNACVPSACEHGWHVRAATPDLTTTIGVTDAGAYYARVDNSGNFYEEDSNYDESNNGAAYYGLSTSDHNSFAVDYGNNGTIKGHGRCSTRNVTTPWYDTENNGEYTFANDHYVSNLTDETGQNGAQYCYCQLDSYTPLNGNAIALSAPWVFFDGLGGADFCADFCASYCADGLRLDDTSALAFRAAVFGSVGASPAMCAANEITINWTGATQEAIDANNAGVATYGGDIRTPQSATPVAGKRFTGWRFSAPTPVSVGE